MTKEEVIEILERFVIGAKPCSQREIVDACASAYGMLKEQPSLPSNLDEAAEEFATTYFKDGRHIIDADRMFGFKAGAEWQKEQMIKDAIELPVKIDGGGYPYIQITGIEFFDYDKDKPTKKEGDVVRILILD